MSQNKHHPITGEMDSIDCLRKERDELKWKLEFAVSALEAIRTHQKISVGANNQLMYKLSTTWNIANSTIGKIGAENGK